MWSFFSYSSGGLLQEMDKLAYTSIPERGYCISPQSVQGLKKRAMAHVQSLPIYKNSMQCVKLRIKD